MASVYDQIGRGDAATAAVDDLYDRLLADPDLAPFFADTDMRRQKAHMRAFMAVALGGAGVYRGRDMAAAHGDLKIRGSHFDRVVGHLVATLSSLSVPSHLIEAIGARLAPLRPQIVTAT